MAAQDIGGEYGQAFNKKMKEEPRRCHIDQVTIHELVEEKIDKDEREELTKAIYSMGEYHMLKITTSCKLISSVVARSRRK